MLVAILIGLLLVASVVAFFVALRYARNAGTGPRPSGGSTEFLGLGDLAVDVELTYDLQRWRVRGVQHVTGADGAAWSAWHLDDRGQGAWMATTSPDDEVVFAVRAEKPETLDPSLESLRWRDHDWQRTTTDGGPAEVHGERRLRLRGPLAPLPATDVERVVFTRPELPARRLVLERSAGEAEWHAWIGTAVPGTMFDVWPPVAPEPGDPRPS